METLRRRWPRLRRRHWFCQQRLIFTSRKKYRYCSGHGETSSDMNFGQTWGFWIWSRLHEARRRNARRFPIYLGSWVHLYVWNFEWEIRANLSFQIGQEDPEIARKMLHGWTSKWPSSLRLTQLTVLLHWLRSFKARCDRRIKRPSEDVLVNSHLKEFKIFHGRIRLIY
jgi:hypothetical protein